MWVSSQSIEALRKRNAVSFSLYVLDLLKASYRLQYRADYIQSEQPVAFSVRTPLCYAEPEISAPCRLLLTNSFSLYIDFSIFQPVFHVNLRIKLP